MVRRLLHRFPFRLTRRCQHCDDRFVAQDGHRELFGPRNVYCSGECRIAAMKVFAQPANLQDLP